MITKNCLQCKKGFKARTNRIRFCIECIKKHRRNYVRNYERLYPERAKQWQNNAIKEYRSKNKDGKIRSRNIGRQVKERKPCEICGIDKNIQKHHPNYAKPLEIIFLCYPCHRKLHNLLKGGKKEQ
jgi:hypothetical protein